MVRRSGPGSTYTQERDLLLFGVWGVGVSRDLVEIAPAFICIGGFVYVFKGHASPGGGKRYAIARHATASPGEGTQVAGKSAELLLGQLAYAGWLRARS